MAVVVVATSEGIGQEMYEQVSGKAMPDGQLPEGAQIHIAGPTESGWRVISVWDSEEQFRQFREERLIPALRETAGEEAVAPSVTADPIHRLITA